MDTARQILRFSIPGSILLLHGLACYFIYRRFQGVTFVDASTAVKENIGALVAVLATIPIGFVVYQAYYFSYAPVVRIWPGSWKGRFVRADRGWRILSSLEPSQVGALEAIFNVDIDVEEPYEVVADPKHWYRNPRQKLQHSLRMLELTGRMREKPMVGDQRKRAYERRWYANWDVLRSILDIAGTIPGSSQIKTEYTVLSDLYHALGAARTAVVSAWSLVLVLAVTHLGRIGDNWWRSFGGAIAISVITWTLYFILHAARRRTWKSASSSLRLGLRWLFWRYAGEFVPDDGKRSSAFERDLAGTAIEEANEEMQDGNRIRDALRSRAERLRERAKDTVERVTGRDDEEDAATPEEMPPVATKPEARSLLGVMIVAICATMSGSSPSLPYGWAAQFSQLRLSPYS